MAPRRPRTPIQTPKYPASALAKLADWCVPPELAPACNIEFVEDASTLPGWALPDKDPALVFRYLDPVSLTTVPLKEYYRARCVDPDTPDPARAGGWGAQLKSVRRYVQPAKSLPQVFFPPITLDDDGRPVTLDWPRIIADATEPLLITEGEGKALAATLHGVGVTLGLGGVDSWRAFKRGVPLLPALESIEWRGRGVSIVFDSDTPTGLKPQVYRAAVALAHTLMARGATVTIATLPPPPEGGPKVALDDYIRTAGVAATREALVANTYSAETYSRCATLIHDYAYLHDINRWIEVNDQNIVMMTDEHFNAAVMHKVPSITIPVERSVRMGNTFTPMLIPTPMKPAAALTMWHGLPRYRGITYRPGAGKAVPLPGGDSAFNIWRGWAAEYVGTDRLPSPARREHLLKEWFWALDNVFGEDPEMRDFAEHWLHYPLQNPGVKLNTLLLVYSQLQGVGKSFIGHMLAKYVYGLVQPGICHAWVLKYGEMERQFNRYKMGTSFIVMDDVSLSAKREFYERLKSDVTETTAQINIKNTPEFTINTCCNYYISSNDMRPLFLNDYDRRAAIHRITRADKAPERYAALDAAFRAGEAGPTILHWAREQYDSRGFAANTEAPMSISKSNLIYANQHDFDVWFESLAATPLSRPLATAQELLALYIKENPAAAEDGLTSTAVGTRLSSMGVPPLRPGGALSGQVYYNGSRGRLWVIGATGEVSREVLREWMRLPFERLAAPRGATRASVTNIEAKAHTRKKY